MSNATFAERFEAVTRIFSRKGHLFSMIGLPKNAENVRHMIVLHPTMARQLANAGFTKKSFIQYLYDKNVLDWDRMTEKQREKLKNELTEENEAEGNRMFVMSPDEVKPGMYREPFSAPENVLVMVAGTGAGNSMVFQAISGSTAPHAEEVEEPRPYMNKVIRGATLTKYGR